MAYTTIDDPSAFFQVLAYTGDSSSTTSADRSLTNIGNSDLQPDIVWIANRDTSVNSGLRWWDSSRGVGENKGLTTSGTNLEGSPNDPEYGYVNTLSSDGFGVRAGANDGNGRWTVDRGEGGGDKYVAWQWKCSGGSVNNNTDGSITTSIQTNSTAGITIGTYTGSSANSGYGTIGHGLGAIPDLVIIKGRDGNGQGGAAQYWIVGAPNTAAFGNGGSKYMFLDTNAAIGTNTTMWYNTNFTTTTIPVGPHAAMNGNTAAYVFYAFKNIQGYSKIGQYKGTYTTTALNSSHETTSPYNGPFIHTGFKPAWVMIKRTDSANNWCIFDNKRTKISSTIREGNVLNEYLEADTTAAHKDYYYTGIDFLSNGFKVRGYDGTINAYGTYLYVAFAENPFVTSTGIPTTAR